MACSRATHIPQLLIQSLSAFAIRIASYVVVFVRLYHTPAASSAVSTGFCHPVGVVPFLSSTPRSRPSLQPSWAAPPDPPCEGLHYINPFASFYAFSLAKTRSHYSSSPNSASTSRFASHSTSFYITASLHGNFYNSIANSRPFIANSYNFIFF